MHIHLVVRLNSLTTKSKSSYGRYQLRTRLHEISYSLDRAATDDARYGTQALADQRTVRRDGALWALRDGGGKAHKGGDRKNEGRSEAHCERKCSEVQAEIWSVI